MVSFLVNRKRNENLILLLIRITIHISLVIKHKKTNSVTSPKMKSPSTLEELSTIDNSMLTRKKQQPSKTRTPIATKTPTYKAK